MTISSRTVSSFAANITAISGTARPYTEANAIPARLNRTRSFAVRATFTRQAIRRGTFTSVKDLIAAIEAFIDGWNQRCQPFTWTKTADEILTKASRGHRSSFTRH